VKDKDGSRVGGRETSKKEGERLDIVKAGGLERRVFFGGNSKKKLFGWGVQGRERCGTAWYGD